MKEEREQKKKEQEKLEDISYIEEDRIPKILPKREISEDNSEPLALKKDTEKYIPITYPKFSFNWINLMKILGGIAGAVLIIMGLIWLLTPEKDTLTVKQVNWNYSVSIQEKITFIESDWSVPIGARVYDERQEVHHQDEVIDHYESVPVEKYEDVIISYEKDYEDLGNGYFAEVQGDPIYDRVYYTDEEEVPVYKYVDVYQTKYYYYIDRWEYHRSVNTSGTDKNPYFGDFFLSFNEREGGRTKSYSIDVINKDNEHKTYTISEDEWKEIDKGDVLEVEVSKLGVITEIISIEKR